MSDQDLRDELVTLLLGRADRDPLAWVFERLLRHPDKLDAPARGGARGRGATSTWTPSPGRPCACARRCRSSCGDWCEPMRLGGYTIPAGTTVAPCIHLIHRREDVYPQPRSFMPERFLERPAGTYTWIPFGGGVRRCLAASFALLEMKQRDADRARARWSCVPSQSRSEQVTRSAIAFSPDQQGLVVVTRRTPDADAPTSGAGR